MLETSRFLSRRPTIMAASHHWLLPSLPEMNLIFLEDPKGKHAQNTRVKRQPNPNSPQLPQTHRHRHPFNNHLQPPSSPLQQPTPSFHHQTWWMGFHLKPTSHQPLARSQHKPHTIREIILLSQPLTPSKPAPTLWPFISRFGPRYNH